MYANAVGVWFCGSVHSPAAISILSSPPMSPQKHFLMRRLFIQTATGAEFILVFFRVLAFDWSDYVRPMPLTNVLLCKQGIKTHFININVFCLKERSYWGLCNDGAKQQINIPFFNTNGSEGNNWLVWSSLHQQGSEPHTPKPRLPTSDLDAKLGITNNLTLWPSQLPPADSIMAELVLLSNFTKKKPRDHLFLIQTQR